MMNTFSLSQDQIEFVAANLRHEKSLCATLLELMLSEQLILQKRNIEGLQSVLTDKSKLLTEIESSSQRRLQCFGIRAIHKNHSQLFESQIQPYPHLIELWFELKNMLQRCNQQNEINGRIIDMSQKSVERTMNLFRQSMRPHALTTYSSKGMAMRSNLHLSGVEA